MTHYTNNLSLCRLTAFALGFLILAIAAGGAFGVVWMRKSVAESAHNTAVIERHIKQAERRSAALEARIAKAHSPQYLASRVPAYLRPTETSQIVWMPAAKPLSPVDYHDPTLEQKQAVTVVAEKTSAPRAPHQVADAAAPRAPVASAESTPGEDSPLSISFDLALINRQRAAGTNSP
ncbi:MAG: hypothetical protein AAFX93_06815 [Verrucomicrobiota bacterium]